MFAESVLLNYRGMCPHVRAAVSDGETVDDLTIGYGPVRTEGSFIGIFDEERHVCGRALCNGDHGLDAAGPVLAGVYPSGAESLVVAPEHIYSRIARAGAEET